MSKLVQLNTGYRIPQIGLGTYKMSIPDARRSVAYALGAGYRHIDTAQMYLNEEGVGAGMKDSGVPREDIFVTTKLNNDNHAPDKVRSTFEESLRKLDTDYVDLFLIHWPMLDGSYVGAWKTMEELVAEGKIRSIGVSNFQPHHLATLLASSETEPAVNQIELHPYFQNREVALASRSYGVVIEAWSPIARGAVFGEESIKEIAAAHGASPAQVVLAWHLAKGYVVFPKSVHEKRMEENLASAELVLTGDEMDAIDALDRGAAGRTGMHPDTMKHLNEA